MLAASPGALEQIVACLDPFVIFRSTLKSIDLLHGALGRPGGRHMRLAGIDLNLLVILDALLRESSVTAAAQRVGLSQSATSHALARLREHLDDPILLRTHSGMTTTARARALTGSVRQILEGAEGVFHISIDPAGQLTFLPPLIERLHREAPNLSIVSPSHFGGSPVSDLHSGAVDFAIGSQLPTAENSIRAEFLVSTDYTSILRRDHPVVTKRLTLKKFLDLEHVAVTRPSLADPALDAALAERKLARRIALSIESPAPVPFIVARTDLVATIPSMMLDLIPASDRMQRHRPPIDLPPVPVFLLFHERLEGSAPHAWMAERIHDVFEELPVLRRRPQKP